MAAAVGRQVTCRPYGHILTNTAVWSPDGEWIVYDTRSDPAGTVFDGTRIERVHVPTGRFETLYESRHGACCGVATYHPFRDEVVFIHGPEDPTPDWSYSACHRRGVVVDTARPGVCRNLDARDLLPPFTAGALRGGSHVHVFSGDGQLVSFTYDDHVLTELDAQPGAVPDRDFNQRNVGICAVGQPVTVPKHHPRNHDGSAFAVLVTQTVNHPQPGTDEISRAYEDAWVGTQGYLLPNGERQRALAFLGDCVSAGGQPLTELFLVEVPGKLTQPGARPLEGTQFHRPAPPWGTVQRRLTRTGDRKYPGIQGPRHWPRSSAGGSQIAFLMRDERGLVQAWTISPLGEDLRQVTEHPFDVGSALSWHPAGTHLTYLADNRVWITAVDRGQSECLTPRPDPVFAPRAEACVFSPDGRWIAFVQPNGLGGAICNQIFVVESGLG